MIEGIAHKVQVKLYSSIPKSANLRFLTIITIVLFFSIITSCLIFSDNVASSDPVGNIFTSETIEGIEVTYIVTSESLHQVQVGSGSNVAVDSNTSGTLTIPSTVMHDNAVYSVTSLSSRSFYSCQYISAIVLPDSITSLSSFSFFNCSSLTSIEVSSNNQNYSSSDGVLFDKDQSTLIHYPAGKMKTSYSIPIDTVTVEDYAFFDSIYLTSIIVSSGVVTIGNGAFEDCNGLLSISLPDSVMSIGINSFLNCESLRNIVVSDSSPIYSSSDGVLFNKAQTTLICYPAGKTDSAYTIPFTVTSIDNYAFYHCSKLVSLELTSNVLSVGNYCFDSCYDLTSIIIPNGLESIGNDAFTYCTHLTSILIPDTVTSIGDHAFYCCVSLDNITVSAGNTSYSSFDGVLFDEAVANLMCYPSGKTNASYIIPNTVTSISRHAFCNCKYLTSITVSNGDADYSSFDGVLFNEDQTTLICYPAGKVDALFDVPDTVTTILDSAFYGCHKLGSIVIPNSVTAINDHTFAGCSSLESVTMGDGITVISSWAFYGCSSLISMNIPEGVISIGEYAFASCHSLKTISISESVVSIGMYTFYNCPSTESITVSEGNANYSSSNGVLYDDEQKVLVNYPVGSSNNTYVIPDGVVAINHYAFYGSSNLEYLTIPASVKTIGRFAMENCSSMTSITVLNGSTIYSSIDGVLFSSDQKTLICYPAGKEDSSYSVPAGVRTINHYAFYGCSNLISVTIPEGIESVGSNSFQNCHHLESITVPDDLLYICGDSFSGCSSLKTMIITFSSASTSSDGVLDKYFNLSSTSWKLPGQTTRTITTLILGTNEVSVPFANIYGTSGLKLVYAEGQSYEHNGIAWDVVVSPSQVVVLYNCNGGYSSESFIYINTGGSIISFPMAYRANYAITGWYTEAIGGTEVTTSMVFSSNSMIYAQWVQIAIATFVGNGTTYSMDVIETYGSPYVLPATDPTRMGYMFAGWYTTEKGGNQITASTSVDITAATTFYAHWIENSTYTVTFSSGPGYNVSFDGSTNVSSGGSLIFAVSVSSGYVLNSVTATGGTLSHYSSGYIISDITADSYVNISVSVQQIGPDTPTGTDGDDSSYVTIGVAAGAMIVTVVASLAIFFKKD